MKPLHVNITHLSGATSASFALDGDTTRITTDELDITLIFNPCGYRADNDTHPMLDINIQTRADYDRAIKALNHLTSVRPNTHTTNAQANGTRHQKSETSPPARPTR